MRTQVGRQVSPSIPEFSERPMHPCEAGLQLFSPHGVFVTSCGATSHVRLVAAKRGGYLLFLNGGRPRDFADMAAAVKAAMKFHLRQVSQKVAA